MEKESKSKALFHHLHCVQKKNILFCSIF